MKLTEMKCVPCEGVPPFDKKKTAQYIKQLPKGWSVVDDGKRLRKEFTFKSFPETMAFVNKIALIAQEEGHHPDMEVHYAKLIVEFWTHAISGLSENDFIMAAKIENR